MKNLYLLFLLFIPAFSQAQIGVMKDSIIRMETCNESVLRSDSSRLHYTSGNINTYYYFDSNNTCNYILKITPKANLSKLKEYLQCNRFKYDPGTSIYTNKEVKGEIEYNGRYIMLKLYLSGNQATAGAAPDPKESLPDK